MRDEDDGGMVCGAADELGGDKLRRVCWVQHVRAVPGGGGEAGGVLLRVVFGGEGFEKWVVYGVQCGGGGEDFVGTDAGKVEGIDESFVCKAYQGNPKLLSI